MSKPCGVAVLILFLFLPCLAQTKQRTPVCRAPTFAAFQSLPQLNYECPDNGVDSDDQILKLPARLKSLNEIATELESFTDAAWWGAEVSELNACDLHGQAGALTDEEKEKYTSGDYWIRLLGDHSLRLAIIEDPCYQTGYSGSAAFLLYRYGGRVYVTKVLDGYYSRLENSIGFDFANINGQQVVEISTANNMTPAIRNYYFGIDAKTHRAVPKKLFKTNNILANEIGSAMILSAPGEVGLPLNSKDTQVISHHRLVPSLVVYAEDFGASEGRKLNWTRYRWNGRFYVVNKSH
ncbi:MAG TPA: hypothetical protein VLL54_06955 [Pyrinomonadaceae bacterium]|nr:hypothetical protein [Pyrinomonadaceae bacterium]